MFESSQMLKCGSFSDLKMQHNFGSMSSSETMVSSEFLSTIGSKNNQSEFMANQVLLSYKETGPNGSILEAENVHSEASFYKISWQGALCSHPILKWVPLVSWSPPLISFPDLI